MEIGSLPEKEFRVIGKMILSLRKRMEKMQKYLLKTWKHERASRDEQYIRRNQWQNNLGRRTDK